MKVPVRPRDRASVEAGRMGRILAVPGGGRQEIMVCVAGCEWTRAEERQEVRSRGPGPQHAGLTGHAEELERVMGRHRRVLGE